MGEHGRGIPLGYYKKANQWAELIPLKITGLEKKGINNQGSAWGGGIFITFCLSSSPVSRNLSAPVTPACCSSPQEGSPGRHQDLPNTNPPERQDGENNPPEEGQIFKQKIRLLYCTFAPLQPLQKNLRRLGARSSFQPALNAHVCGKLFMRLIKMNVFIRLLSTKGKGALGREAGGVWWDEMRARALLGCSGTRWCRIAEGSK